MVPNGMKYIDNFIEDPEVEKLLVEKFTGNDFPWFYSSHVAYGGEKNSSFYFVHMFYREGKQQSDLFDLLHPVLGRLKFNHLLNIRANCYTKTEKPFTHDWHLDRKVPHKVALFGIIHYRIRRGKNRERVCRYFYWHTPNGSNSCY